MNKLKLFLVAFIALAVVSACSGSPKSLTADLFHADNYLMSSTEVGAILGDEQLAAGVHVLDVRTPDEFHSGCVKGAANIDFEAADFETKLASLDKSANYLVYCRSGRRSALAVAKMREMGFTNILELAGGINAWKENGEPLSQSCN